MIRESRSLFSSGLETVRAHARFSAMGQEIFESEASAALPR
jgi:hypothetical protein